MVKKKAKVQNSKSDQEWKNQDVLKLHNGLTEAILGSPGNDIGKQVSRDDTMFINNRWYLISNKRQLLSQSYAEHGIIRAVVDRPVDDGFKGGIDVKTDQLDENQIQDLISKMEECGDIEAVSQGRKWARLFGGGGVVINVDGRAAEPLEINKIKKGSRLRFIPVDMWELYFGIINMSDDDDFELMDNRYNAGNQLDSVQSFNYYGTQIDASRVIKMKGFPAPSFIRPQLRGWGLSALESFVRSINQYLKSTDLSFEVLDEFKLDIFKIKDFNNSLLTKNGTEAVNKRLHLANMQKNFLNSLAMDSEDDYIQKQLSFTGISEAMEGIRMQIAADLRMPLTKIFGVSAAGFNSGEDDIENYNGMIESEIRSKSKFDIIKVVQCRCAQMFGTVPDDLKIEFHPLREMSSEQEENVKTQKFSRLAQAKQLGVITADEFREACNKDDLFPIRLDDSVEFDSMSEDEMENEYQEEGEITADEASASSMNPQAPEPPKQPEPKS